MPWVAEACMAGPDSRQAGTANGSSALAGATWRPASRRPCARSSPTASGQRRHKPRHATAPMERQLTRLAGSVDALIRARTRRAALAAVAPVCCQVRARARAATPARRACGTARAAVCRILQQAGAHGGRGAGEVCQRAVVQRGRRPPERGRVGQREGGSASEADAATPRRGAPRTRQPCPTTPRQRRMQRHPNTLLSTADHIHSTPAWMSHTHPGCQNAAGSKPPALQPTAAACPQASGGAHPE